MEPRVKSEDLQRANKPTKNSQSRVNVLFSSMCCYDTDVSTADDGRHGRERKER